MFREALGFPVSGNDWLPTTVIGGVLGVLGFLVVPGVILQGYYVRVLRSAAAGDDHLPSFTEWTDLLVDGVKALVVAFVYALAVVVPTGVVAVVAGVVGAGPGGRANLLAGLLGLAGAVVVGVLGLAVSFVLPAALANFAIEGSFGAAFDFRRIADGVGSGRYVLGWVGALVLGFLGSLVAGALTVFLVGFFLLFHVQVVVFYLFGRGFAEGLGRYGDVSSPPGAAFVPSDEERTAEEPEFGSLGGLERVGGDDAAETADESDVDATDAGDETTDADERGDSNDAAADSSDGTDDDSSDGTDDDSSDDDGAARR
ncbi:MAG: DUF4013 domain-containing protein [Haloplanus sp.]